MPINFFPSNPAARKTREPKLCACGCGLMHTKRGKYATDVCAKRAWKAEHPDYGKNPPIEKTTKAPARDWKRAILACRADDGTCRYVGKMTKESEIAT